MELLTEEHMNELKAYLADVVKLHAQGMFPLPPAWASLPTLAGMLIQADEWVTKLYTENERLTRDIDAAVHVLVTHNLSVPKQFETFGTVAKLTAENEWLRALFAELWGALCPDAGPENYPAIVEEAKRLRTNTISDTDRAAILQLVALYGAHCGTEENAGRHSGDAARREREAARAVLDRIRALLRLPENAAP